ncbi:MAG: ABC transporter permease [Marinilabiliales bacterium]|nr:MAG: ABC transporter permease [Marinilabiliales bacterium]
MTSKSSIVIAREYLTRVRKKSFIIMTILGPILFAAVIVGPAWFATLEDREVRVVAVIDSSKLFIGQLPETDYLRFEYLEHTTVEELREKFDDTDYYAVLYIAHIIASTPSAVQLMSDRQPGMNVRMHIANALEKELERQKLAAYDIEDIDRILESVKTRVSIRTIIWQDDGGEKESYSELAMIVGYVGGFLIYFFIFLFGAQVMRGVIEEKSSRVVEIIVSSVRPFQLMLGKIVGIGLVGLTQFLLWVILSVVLVVASQQLFFPDIGTPSSETVVAEELFTSGTLQQSQPVTDDAHDRFGEMFASISSINFSVMLLSFLFYFLGGYLLYASLFAAIGSAVDNETDTQQFMLPITIPLIISIIVMMNAIMNPYGPIAFWFSIIPFTSPIIMMARIPFGVPFWEVALSAGLLVVTFIFTTWLAGKIYRTGILMYGKKVNYKELWKWIRYTG